MNKDVDSDAEYANGYVTDYIVTRADVNDLEELVLERGESTPISDDYFVKLEKYRLTNLNKKVFAVRHVADIDYKKKSSTEFGELGTQDYLVDPYTDKKNGTATNYTTWFT